MATDFVTDLTDGLLVGDRLWLATDFVTDLTDGLLVGQLAMFVVIALAILNN